MYSPGESREIDADAHTCDRIVATVWAVSEVALDLVGLFYWAALLMCWVIAVAPPP